MKKYLLNVWWICCSVIIISCDNKETVCTKTIVHYLDNKHIIKSYTEEVLCSDTTVRHGLVKVFDNSGNIIVGVTTYVRGKKSGEDKTFHFNGQLASYIVYRQDTIVGRAIDFLENGDTTRVVEFRNGKPYNVLLYKDANGQDLNYGTLKDGTGTIIVYDENGKVINIDSYTDGIKYSAKYVHYDLDGTIDTVSFPITTTPGHQK